MKKRKEKGARPWLCAVALTLCLSTVNSIAGEAPVERELSSLSPLEQSELEVQLSDKINEALRGHRFSEEQAGPIIVTVRLDLQEGELLVDLGEENGPWSESLEMEDLHKGITEIAFKVLGHTAGWHGVDLRFGGKDMYFWFPELRPQNEKASARKSVRKRRAIEPEKVVLSAGHGVYFHHGFKDWRPQRERSFSILEDDITQDFVEELSEHLSKEGWWKVPSLYLPVLTRSLGSNVHEPSARPWARPRSPVLAGEALPRKPWDMALHAEQ
jgi:N-acetylmuramoyl-L-alanine amidase